MVFQILTITKRFLNAKDLLRYIKIHLSKQKVKLQFLYSKY